MGCDLKRFLLALLLLRICDYAAASNFSFALPNCKDHCGIVDVPYPFGIGQGCYKDKWFEIVCRNSSEQLSVPFLLSIEREVISISIVGLPTVSYDETNKFYILSPLKHSGCSNGVVGDSSPLNLTGSPFFISDKNKFTAVGCNNKASMNGTGLQIVGCEATCRNEIQSFQDDYKSCVGYKCCQTSIPPNLLLFDATLEKLEPSKDGCQVAYLSQFNLEGYMFTAPQLSEYGNYTRMELEWRFDLPSTSTDTDECIDPKLNVCGKNKCVNVPGSFKCRKTWLTILSGTLSAGLLLLVIGMWLLCKANKKRRVAKQKRKFFKRNGGLLLQQQTSFLQGSVNRTKLFSSRDLEKATDKFNASRILGQGGQGTVYKGMLEDGIIVAVKKSKALEEENLEEFINEIILLSQINHRNVVKILGCCLETENPSEDFPMTWEVRLCIACEVADALLPAFSRLYSNISQRCQHRAKVADFGISRSVPIDDTHLTTIVQGTVGYVDPEYLQSNHFTGKSDVYSFGVLLIELLTGEKPVSLLRRQEVRLLGAYFLEAMRNDRLHEILDARIMEECDQEEVFTVAKLARRCLSLNSQHRPTMRVVSIELDRMQSKKKEIQNQAQNSEEHAHIQIAIPESMSLSYTSPEIVIENSSFSLDSKPLMPHKTQ
ncbi:unnamed protein product [Arabis nemorensis]|uniref:Protein kinase domain-containing protein n=1 Tax=Arabis nemorensis TaxID=586526 RepID=A0A565AR50_9BRAS|nr:unnamed protein product [Arabis nemorensis]